MGKIKIAIDWREEKRISTQRRSLPLAIPFRQIRCHRNLRLFRHFHSHTSPNTLQWLLAGHHQNCYHSILIDVLNAFVANNPEPNEWINECSVKSGEKFTGLDLNGQIDGVHSYRLTFWILKWTQSNVAFVVNRCRVREFMCWK